MDAPSNPYQHFIAEYARFAREGRSYPLGTFPRQPKPDIAGNAPKALIFSPHPDDEVIIGGIALRLLRESHWNVINVAVTLGSNPDRQLERYEELKRCCSCVGFGLVPTTARGLEQITPRTREEDPQRWRQSVGIVAGILEQHQPRVILFPHAHDWNSTHVGTHHLVMDALAQLPEAFECYTVETEFWGQNPTPNLLVELSPLQVSDLITALTFHVGEVRRNPYHLTVPAWMLDNVRRGAELVGGQGQGSPDFVFGTLYQVRHWGQGRLEEAFEGGRFLPGGQKADTVFA